MNNKMIRTTICMALIVVFNTFLTAQERYYPITKIEDKEHVMSDAYWDIWTPEVQKQIDCDIEQYRKADCRMVLDDIDTSKPVEVSQLTHAFVFGAHIFNYNQLGNTEANNRYKELYGTLFNSATVAFYWRVFEPEPKHLRFKSEYQDTEEFWNECPDPQYQPHWRRPATDDVISFLKSKHVRIHGHTLVWGNRKWNHPDWLHDKMMTEKEKTRFLSMLKNKANLQNYKDGDDFTQEYKDMSAKELETVFPRFAKDRKSVV